MKIENKRYQIDGWSGEHNETGASIIDTKTGTRIAHTASRDRFESEAAYTYNAKLIVEALNAFGGMFGSLTW